MSSEETIRKLREGLADLKSKQQDTATHQIMETASLICMANGLSVVETVSRLGKAYITLFLLIRRKDKPMEEIIQAFIVATTLVIRGTAEIIQKFEKDHPDAG